MINRRQFVQAGTAGALLTGVPGAFAASFDLIIKGGRVIDPSAGLDAVRDVAIAGGKIVAVDTNTAGDAAATIDARGKVVAPGLIDIHTHAARSKEGPPLALLDGVTGWIDAGSGGADNIDQVAAIARGAPQIGRILVNIARTGVSPGGELMDITKADVDLARGAVVRNRDEAAGVGVKATDCQTNVAGMNDLEALRRAQEVASTFGLPVMIQYRSIPTRRCAPFSRCSSAGDIVTHMYAPAPDRILDDQDQLFPEVYCGASAWRAVRLRQWGRGAFQLGWRGAGDAARFLARHHLDGLERHVEDDGRRRFPQRHVEVHHVGHAAQPDHRVCDDQPGVSSPRSITAGHSTRRCAGRRRDLGAAGRDVRISRQLQGRANGPSTAVPERNRARRQARAKRLVRRGHADRSETKALALSVLVAFITLAAYAGAPALALSFAPDYNDCAIPRRWSNGHAWAVHGRALARRSGATRCYRAS